jgi:glycosyltransferase involved in cell wall biosynthesis
MSMTRTTFGIVTPTLNAERYLRSTLESVWAQRSEHVEVDHVIVDGGSGDRTLEIASAFPSRVSVGRDDGMYDALNRGFGLVSGEVLGYINADDEIAPGALRLVAEAFARHPGAMWLCGAVEYIDGRGQVLGRMLPVPLDVRSYAGLGWSCIPQQTVWVRRSFFATVGPFDTTFRYCGDYDWYARALQLAHPLIVPATLGRFRIHGENLSFNEEAMRRESRLVQERWGGLGMVGWVRGRYLSLRLNLRNPGWLVAKKRGRIRFRP